MSIPNMSSRQTKRLMRKMGLNMDSIPNVEQVIIKTKDKIITIEDPEVALLEVQGQKIFQISGANINEEKSEIKISIPEEDVILVAEQTGKDVEAARKVLEECEGDLAKAILLIQSRK